MDKPIPAFYACYLLRSTIRHASQYVGSTPNPVRRLRQHNGDAKGGAVRTSKDSLRPWEMTCLVTGFPSKVAALQFEWAWQNTHLTRHISPNSRLTQSRTAVRFSPKTGRMRKRTARPRMSLTDRLANLHALLRSNSFERWPLKVTFYVEDVFRVWQKWTAHELVKVPSRTEIVLDESSMKAVHANDHESAGERGIYALDVGYTGLKSQLEKSKAILGSAQSCTFCHELLPADGATTLVCPSENCSTAGHLECFASSSLEGENDSIVPISSNCPGCGTKVQWVDLVKELSLRMRAPAEVDKILKVKKMRKAKAEEYADARPAAADHEPLEEDDDMDDNVPLKYDWHYLSDDTDAGVDENHIQSDSTAPTFRSRQDAAFTSRSEPWIEDSDWSEAEVVL